MSAPLRTGREVVEAIESATPPGRDRAIDALRALAIGGVVLGHWLVTALVLTDGGLHVASPLAYQPGLVPATWVFQTLALFFLVGGYAAARGLASARRSGLGWRSWLASRLVRFGRPVLALLAFWVIAAAVSGSLGYSADSTRVLLLLAVSPLWYLAVYAGLTALTPLVVAVAHRRGPVFVPVACVVVVGVVDLVRIGLSGPAWLGWVNLLAAWLVPYCLGVAWSAGVRPRPVALLGGGLAATAVLVLVFGYPASMVGVPTDAWSNLNPPTLAAVTFGLAQAGLAMLAHAPLTRLTRRRRVWAAVALTNLAAMTIFLWHQTALLLVTTFGLGYGTLRGLHAPPADLQWTLHRILWLPVFAAVLAALIGLFLRFERPRRAHASAHEGDQGAAGVRPSPTGRPTQPAADRGAQPPAMAPSTMKGSSPLTTRSGNGASGGSLERSSSQA